VQNEFAPASFDGKELKSNSSSDFALLEINNGSVSVFACFQDL
jgi:hypothetical protein